jgi:hypothetical protein
MNAVPGSATYYRLYPKDQEPGVPSHTLSKCGQEGRVQELSQATTAAAAAAAALIDLRMGQSVGPLLDSLPLCLSFLLSALLRI